MFRKNIKKIRKKNNEDLLCHQFTTNVCIATIQTLVVNTMIIKIINIILDVS